MINKSNIICFDIETTGLDADIDDILQISIIDGEGNTLIDSLVKPIVRKEWPEAMAVNGITPEMVKDAPTYEELMPKVKEIFESADTWISYNGSFDLKFLRAWGIKRTTQKHVDVMFRFADYYKEPDGRHPGEYRWKRLTFAAEHFGFDWQEKAHNSLGDVKATLYVNGILDDIAKGEDHFLWEGNHLIWMYYNPDSVLDGQYVENYLSAEKLMEKSTIDSPRDYFSSLETEGVQFLHDTGRTGFSEAAYRFATKTELTGQTEETMKAIKEKAQEVWLHQSIQGI